MHKYKRDKEYKCNGLMFYTSDDARMSSNGIQGAKKIRWVR